VWACKSGDYVLDHVPQKAAAIGEQLLGSGSSSDSLVAVQAGVEAKCGLRPLSGANLLVPDTISSQVQMTPVQVTAPGIRSPDYWR
jgi:hypothetical protein